MVEALLDTAIMIDLLRGFPDAERWLQDQPQTLGVTLYVWLEVIQGAPNKINQKRAIRLLNSFALVEVTSEDVHWAVAALTRTALTHNTDLVDCLIAATAARLNVPLYTRNLKHFTPLLKEAAIAPY